MAYAKFPAVRALIFDLDGTLIDSKLDLIHSVNAMMSEMKRPRLSEETISGYIGHGAPQLVTRALGGAATEEELKHALQFFLGYYEEHKMDNTCAYPGVGLTLVNETGGTINSNFGPNTLLVLSGQGGITNAGLMEATSQAHLMLSGVTINNAGGTILGGFDGGTVNLDNATVLGGTLKSGSGVIVVGSASNLGPSQATLDGSTAAGAVTIQGAYGQFAGSQTLLRGTINNQGTLVVISGNTLNTHLTISGDTILQGGGTVLLDNFAGNPTPFLDASANGVTLTNVNNTIQGMGVIGSNIVGGNCCTLELVNGRAGIINANVASSTLFLGIASGSLSSPGATWTNAGLIEGTDSNVLNLTGVTLNNAGGTISSANGGVVFLSNATIMGGTLAGFGNGLTGGGIAVGFGFDSPGSSGDNPSVAALDGSTAAGAVTIQGNFLAFGGDQLFLRGTINNQGTMNVLGDPLNHLSTSLTLNGNTTLQGGGTVVLNSFSTLSANANGLTLTNVDNTVQGAGVIGAHVSPGLNNPFSMALVNGPAGIITANIPGETLQIQNASVTNAGLMEATGSKVVSGGGATSSILQLSGLTINNAGGTIAAANGGAVFLNNTTVMGGTLDNTGGLMFAGTVKAEPVGNVTLDGSTPAGAVTIKGIYFDISSPGSPSQTVLLGSINNQGTISVLSQDGADGHLTLNANTTLQGGGTVNLATTVGSGIVFLNPSVSGLTLTNLDNAIQGAGVIGPGGPTMGLANGPAGTINANVSGQQLVLAPALGVTNAGLMEATGGAILGLIATVNNTAGTIAANGASSLVSLKSNITGGTITALNGGMVQLEGATIQGATLNNVSGTLGTPAAFQATLDGSTAAGAVKIQGTYTADVGSTTVVLGTINNQGNIRVNGGGFTNAVLFLVGNTSLQGGGTVTLANVGGGGASFVVPGTSGLTLTNVDNTVQGSGQIGSTGGNMTLMNGAAGTILANTPGQTLTIDTDGFTSAGSVQVKAGSTLEVLAPFQQTGGMTQLDHGTLVVAQGESVSGGSVLGTGLIRGNVTLTGGTMQPGVSGNPGLLIVDGNYAHSGATFEELISGAGNGLLFVNGSATLGPGSLLDITLQGGFTAFFGELFTLMDFTTGMGAFANAPSTGFQMDGFNWTIEYGATSIVLDASSPVTTATPEPSGLVLLSTGLAALSGFRRKRAAASR